MIAGPLAQPLARPLATKVGSTGTGFPYPRVGRVLDLAAFTYTYSEVDDKSPEDNKAVMYNARGVACDGVVGRISLGDLSAYEQTGNQIKLLARSSTDTVVVVGLGTDEVYIEINGTIVADGTWQEVTLTINAAPLDDVYINGGNVGAAPYQMDFANFRLVNGNNTHEQFYLNDHTDTAANGLDGLPVIGRNGNIGQYVGCAAVVQEGFDSALAGLGAYGDRDWFNGTDTLIDYGSPLLPATADFDESFTIYVGNDSAPSAFLYYFIQDRSSLPGATGFAIASSTGYLTFIADAVVSIQDTSKTYYLEFVDVRITRNSGVFELFLNGTSIGTDATKTSFSIPQAGSSVWGDSPLLGNRHALGLIYGDNVTGTPSGTFNTVAELRTTPPQVLGMNHKNYMWLDGVDDDITTGGLLPATADFTFTVKFLPIAIPSVSESIYGSLNSGDAGRHVIQVNSSGQAFAFIAGLGGSMQTGNTINLYEINTITLTKSGTNWLLALNGGSASITTGSTTLDTAGSSIGDPYSGANFLGLISKLKVGSTDWDGTKADAEAKGWTVNGTPDNLLVSESLNAGIDALGNALTPRTSKTFNADGSGKWEVPDAASLAACKSWSCRYYHTAGQSATILDLGTPTISATALDALTSTGITGATYYVNGAAGTALSAGWNSICVTTATATDCGPISGSDPTELLSDVKAYNIELTFEQVSTLP